MSTNNYGKLSGQCLTPGITRELCIIEKCIISLKIGELLLMCKPWFLAIWEIVVQTGVCFTRNPSTGEKEFFGEYLINAQGEDVVAGIRTPRQITIKGKEESYSNELSMEEAMPDVYQELIDIYQKLEAHYKDMQDIEFTVQNNKLWILQTRSGKRTALATVKIAVDMVKEGLISREEAIMRVNPEALEQLLHPTIDASANKNILCVGLHASPGAASGVVCFCPERAQTLSKNKKIILVRSETSPEDINGMDVAEGILTVRGGMTSHAAVVARGMGTPCVVGASKVLIDEKNKTMSIANNTIHEGDTITINGSTGEVILGNVPTIQPKLSDEFKELIMWADEMKAMKVRANAEVPKDARVACNFGAEGIGLCRTEHNVL